MRGGRRSIRGGVAMLPHHGVFALLRVFTLAFVFLCVLSSAARAQAIVTTSPSKVKAAFIRNFAHYVTWPDSVFVDEKLPWKIGILGDDPFDDILEKTLKGRTEQKRPFEVFRAQTCADLPFCHIVFISLKDEESRRAALLYFRNKAVLTVGDDVDFLNEGGIIRFRLEDTIRIDINLDQAQAVSLTVQTKMLEIAGVVIEKGKVRKLR